MVIPWFIIPGCSDDKDIWLLWIATVDPFHFMNGVHVTHVATIETWVDFLVKSTANLPQVSHFDVLGLQFGPLFGQKLTNYFKSLHAIHSKSRPSPRFFVTGGTVSTFQHLNNCTQIVTFVSFVTKVIHLSIKTPVEIWFRAEDAGEIHFSLKFCQLPFGLRKLK